MNEICSHNVQCVCAYQQEEFLRPQPDTLSDLTAMPRANQHVHISMNTHQNIIRIPYKPPETKSLIHILLYLLYLITQLIAIQNV